MISDGKIPPAPGTNQIAIKTYIVWVEVHSFIVFVATARVRVATILSFWWIESILEGLSETFGSRSIFLAPENAGHKFDKHLISIDFTGYKNTNKLIV